MMLESTGPKMEPCGTPPVTGDSLMLFRSKGFPVPQQGGHSKMWDISVWRPHPRLHWDQFWGWKYNPAVTSRWQESVWLERNTHSLEQEAHMVLQSSSTSCAFQSVLSQSPTLIPVPQVKSCLSKSYPPPSFALLLLWRWGIYIESFHAGSLDLTGQKKNAKKVYFYIQGFFFLSVSLHWYYKKLEILSKR